MKLLQHIGNWIDVVVSLLSAAFLGLGLAELQTGRLVAQGGVVKSHRCLVITAVIVLATLLALGALLRAVLRLVGADRCRYLIYETPNGRVSIRTRSVEAALNRSVRSVFDVADAQTTVSVPRGAAVPTEIRVRCRLYDRPNLLASQDQVRAAARQRYHELFPGEESLPVEVLVENIIFQAPPTRLPPKPAPEPDTEEEEDTEPGLR